MWVPSKFSSPWVRQSSRNFNWSLFRSILWMRVQNLKFVALPAPETIGGITITGYVHAPYSPKFLMTFCSDGPCELYQTNLKSVAVPVPEIIAIAVFGWGCEYPILGNRPCLRIARRKRLKPLTALSGTAYRLTSSMSDHTPVLFNVWGVVWKICSAAHLFCFICN